MDYGSQSADLATTMKAEMSNELLNQLTAHKESPQPLHAFLLHAIARAIYRGSPHHPGYHDTWPQTTE